MKTKEMWKDITNYEGLYMISSLGRVKSLRRKTKSKGGSLRSVQERIFSKHTDLSGYPIVGLRHPSGKKITYTIHRLMAKEFLDYNEELQVNHIDGDKGNNNLNNLEMVTRSENVRHAVKLGLIDHRGEKAPLSKLSDEIVVEVKKLLENGMKQADIGSLFGVHQSTISYIKRGKTWSHINKGVSLC